MRKPSVKCALLAAMIAQHRWGSPIDEENLLSVAAIGTSDYPTASDVFDELRSEPYITTRGTRGIELDNSEFGQLAEVLYHKCDWEPYEIKSRLKHYEGWDTHDWAWRSTQCSTVRREASSEVSSSVLSDRDTGRSYGSYFSGVWNPKIESLR